MEPSKTRRKREQAASFLQKLAMAFMPAEQKRSYAARIRQEAFVRIKREERWGGTLSGGGSTVDYTRATRGILERVLRDTGVKSMLDAGCGDASWVPLVLESIDEGFRYVGGDIVPDLIERHKQTYPQHEFQVIDFVVDELPKCDLIFCRDVIQHLPLSDAMTALRNFSRSGARYLLTTTHLRRFGWRNGRDKRVGQCHDRNLLLKPFSLTDPIVIFSERDPGHKFLGLWELPLSTVDGRTL
jgi:SAM-dependent methyltransferase